LADRFFDRHPDEPLDVLRRRELGAEPVSVASVERAGEEGTEDARLYLRPVRLRGLQQDAEVLVREGERLRIAEEVTVVAEEPPHAEPTADIHRPPELDRAVGELVGVFERKLDERLERPVVEEPHVLREKGEHNANEEARDAFRLVATLFERS